MTDIKVVIVGGLHHNTLGVVRSIGEAGIQKRCIEVLIHGMDKCSINMISQSKYVLQKNVNFVKSENDISAWLINHAQSDKRVIICCSDGAAECVMSNYDVLSEWYFTPSSKIDIHDLMMKEYQLNIAVEVGMRTPKGMLIDKDEFNDWRSFPCITKPCSSVNGGSKADVRVSHSKEELAKSLGETQSQYVQI